MVSIPNYGLRKGLPTNLAWRDKANCFGTDPKHWDSPDGLPEHDDHAWQVAKCRACPVLKECAADAWWHNEIGVIRAGIPIPGNQAHRKKMKPALLHIATYGDIDGGRDLMPEAYDRKAPRPTAKRPPAKKRTPRPDRTPAL